MSDGIESNLLAGTDYEANYIGRSQSGSVHQSNVEYWATFSYSSLPSKAKSDDTSHSTDGSLPMFSFTLLYGRFV
jgi:hypothetical protein